MCSRSSLLLPVVGCLAALVGALTLGLQPAQAGSSTACPGHTWTKGGTALIFNISVTNTSCAAGRRLGSHSPVNSNQRTVHLDGFRCTYITDVIDNGFKKYTCRKGTQIVRWEVEPMTSTSMS